MKNRIAEGAETRLWKAQKAMDPDSVAKKYAADLEKADPAEKEKIHARMLQELEKHQKMMNHKPSAKALW